MRAFLAICALVVAPLTAQAQSSPIPDNKVPGFGGSDAKPSSPGGSPAASGSNVGSNIGAGATASPSPEIISPSTGTSVDEATVPPPGSFGTLTITK